MTAPYRPSARSHPASLTRPLRLGVLTPHNPFDRRCFSGTVHYAVKALSRRSDIDLSVLGPHRPLSLIDQLMRRRSPRFEPEILDPSGADFAGLDVVLGLVASPLLDAARTLTDVQFIHVTDATPGFLCDVYGKDIKASVCDMEARVLARATAIYSSNAMADRAGEEFGETAARAMALPFGVNFDDLPEDLAPKANLERLELLFVGGNWSRKGGDLMLAAFDSLRATGRSAHLTLVGGVPDRIGRKLKARTDVTMAGFLDKNRPKHLKKLKAYFNRAHLFVLPTRADCTPMVVAEALAHGTPVLASDVGGIAQMIGAGAGRTLPLSASPQAWAKTMTEMTSTPMIYDMMVDAATERTGFHLNWDRWAAGIIVAASECTLAHPKAA